VACTPSEAKIMTAIAQTEAANPTATNTITPDPTATQTPSAAPTINPTNTTTPTETPTPSSTPDLRIIEMEPRHFQLEVEDLPKEGRYYMPSGWMSPHLNSEVISGWGIEEGKAYLAETGRITGYWSEFYRGTNTVVMPQYAYCGVIQYKTAEGARLTIEKYSLLAGGTRASSLEFTDAKVDMILGDHNESIYATVTLPGGEVAKVYYVNFAYRNYGVECWGDGLETDVSHEFVENMARAVLAKLEAAPLSESDRKKADNDE